MSEQITIEINGRTLSAKKGQMLIEVTDTNDIYIPRFCYHDKLSVAANCRMCLVEVEKVPKLLPACATPAMDGMKIRTDSRMTLEAQKSIMEFLLINHPLDCPICDQGGECELQDMAMGYGHDISRYQEKKRVVKDKNTGPLIQTDMTRCIHCTRCVRFGAEIAGIRELGATGRGENMEIGTYIEHSITSEMSGNIIDLCPVGALTSKPFRYSARAWELVEKKAIAPHDSVGSNIAVHVKGNRVKRVVPAANEAINEVWLSDRDRFSYEGLYSDDRLLSPMLKEDGRWMKVDWKTALESCVSGLRKVIDDAGAGMLGALASPSATLEELYLTQKFMRAMGSDNIDTRLRQADFSDQDSAPLFPWLGQPIAAFEDVQAALLIGGNIRKDQPIINHRLRKAALNGASVMVVNPIDYAFNYPLAAKSIVPPYRMATELAAVLKALAEVSAPLRCREVSEKIKSVEISERHRRMAKTLLDADNAIVLVGNLATAHPGFSTLRTLAGEIAGVCGVEFGYLSEAANSSGAWLTGAVPHREAGGGGRPDPGMDVQTMLQKKLRGYVLLGVEPELDCWDGQAARRAMSDAECVVSLSAYQSDAMADYADIMLPIAVFTETSGTYINNAGDIQRFTGAVPPLGEAQPAWKVLRVLGHGFDEAGFAYQSSEDVYAEAMQQIGAIDADNMDKWRSVISLEMNGAGLQRISDLPMNRIDPICRRAEALQRTGDVSDGTLHINMALAEKNRLAEGDEAQVEQDGNRLSLKVTIDDRIADECILIQAAHPETVSLGASFASIELVK